MKKLSRFILRLAFVALLFAWSVPALADTIVRVTRDGTSIWTSNFGSTAMVVNTGTALTVVGQRNDWYEVELPGDFRGKTGFVHKANVEVDSGSSGSSDARRAVEMTARAIEHPAAVGQGYAIGVLGFGEFGYARFAAHQSFQAVTGSSGDGFLGAGGEVRVGNLFVNASVNRFTAGGQRVYVTDGQVFKMGVPVNITLTPVAVTAGWRFAHDRTTPYFGGGIGRIHYQERFSFADTNENVDETFSSYHVVGGVEFRNGWVATGFEVQYSRVPDSIGVGGASAAFQESDLGGVVARIRILVGR